MCLKPEDVSSVVDAVNESGKVFAVGFNRRFAPVAVKAKKHFGSEVKCINYIVNAGFIPLDTWIQDPEIRHAREPTDCRRFGTAQRQCRPRDPLLE